MTDGLCKLRELCDEYGLIAVRDDAMGRWDLVGPSPESEWEYARVARVTDVEMVYTPWRLVEKRVVAMILESMHG